MSVTWKWMICLAALLSVHLTGGSMSGALAQEGISTAAITGRITDARQSVIPGAVVSLTDLERNQVRTQSADDAGRYRFPTLPVGRYHMKVESAGFQSMVYEFTLSVGQILDIPVQMSVAGASITVTVFDRVPALESARTQVSQTIRTAEVEGLPINGRNYLDLALLSPGVSRTNTGNNERFAETSAVPGTGISIAGQRNLNSTFVIDGLSANDDAADLAGSFFSQEVIREFSVVTSGGISEFGRASSGIVNILTRSGTTSWQGSLYGFLRNQRLDARNALAARTDPLTQAQYGITAGGPLRRGRAFLFSNFEQEHLNRAGQITISPVNAAAINSALDKAGYLPPRVVTGEFPTGHDRANFLAKTDFGLSGNHRVSARYSLYDISSPNARGVGGLSTVSRGTALADRDQTVALSDVATLSPRAVNEMRAQFTRSRLSAPGNDLVGPAVTVSGIANLGASTTSPTARKADTLEFSDSYSRQSGAHYWKAGADFLHNRVTIAFPGALFGSYSFSSLANFLSGSYSTFQQAFGRTDWFQSNPNLAWFLQDEWRPRPGLTVNAGLRQDIQWLAAGIRTDSHNLSPRLGIAYAPARRKTVVRAGFGLYFDRIPLRAVANALRGAGVDYRIVSLQRTQVGAPMFPNRLESVPGNALLSLATIDPGIKNARGLQANLEIEREIYRGTTVSAGYLHARGTHIIMQRNLNVPTLTSAQDPVNLGRPNPDFANISQYSGEGDSYYNGMTLTVQNHAARWTSVRLSYTLSKAVDDSGNAFFSSPQNNFNLRDDRGLSDNDQRHRLVFSGQLIVPQGRPGNVLFNWAQGFRLSGILTYASAYPFNVLTGGQTLQTTSARVPGIGRNTGRGFNYVSADFRLSRGFRIREGLGLNLLAESFNTFNRVNLQFPNNIFGAGTTPLASFGKATAAADPRQLQFGLRLNF